MAERIPDPVIVARGLTKHFGAREAVRGIDLDVPRGAHVGHDSQTRNSFYHAHWYANPILTWLEVLLDFPCLEKGSLDLAYLTEVDPLWADDELTAILNPEAVLFANAPAKAACAAP